MEKSRMNRAVEIHAELINGDDPQRFLILFDAWYALLSLLVFIPPSNSYVEVSSFQVCVRMSWAFRSCFPRSSIVSVAEAHVHPMSRGVHGFSGRWLVNGSGKGIVTIDLVPAQRAYVMGVPVRLRQLMVSVAEPAALAAALGGHFQGKSDMDVDGQTLND